MALEVTPVYNYEIQVDGLPFGACQEVTLPERTRQIAEYGFGVDTPNVKVGLGETIGDMTLKVLKVAGNSKFASDWFDSKEKKVVTVILLSPTGQAIETNRYIGCFPKTDKPPQLKADKNSTDLMMDELVLSVDRKALALV